MNTHYGFELFYSGGGHCGPFYTLAGAASAARARLNGCRSLAWVDIIARDPVAVGGFGERMRRVRRDEIDDMPASNQMAY